jgi:hypothetical protein
MKPAMLTAIVSDARRVAMTRSFLALGPLAALLAGCIQVKAPDKPIEINLNVNIRQEVVVSLRDDVKNLDKQYPGVF